MQSKLSNLKFSRYNHKIEFENELYLYNALTGGFCKTNTELKELLIKEDISTGDVAILSNINEDIINGLKKGGMLLDKNINELEKVKTLHSLARFGNTNSLGITLVPTTGCNFRCTYCFEKGKEYPNQRMSQEVMDAIVNFVDENLKDNGDLSISWFGGEPLVAFDILQKLQTDINNLAKKKSLNVGTGIVTNGYLLTKQRSDELVKLGIKTVQVTIDGERDAHNKKRFLQNGDGTFDRIIENVINANSDLKISIRVNIDRENVKDISKFLDFLVEVGIDKKENISIYFAVVRDYDEETQCVRHNCFDNREFSKEEVKLNKMAYERGFNVTPRIKPNIINCGALGPNSYLIEPDGTLQKCWTNVGYKERSIGHLLGKMENPQLGYANQYKWLAWNGLDTKDCLDCSILPLCMGGCPYYSLYEDTGNLDIGYRCNSFKYNIEDTLKLIAYKHLKGKK